jgi:hypothetical protein
VSGKQCECGPDCPTCGGKPSGAVDFVDFIPVLEESYGRIRESIKKHGAWGDYDQGKIFAAIGGEFGEYWKALAEGRRSGEHGQIDELYDVIVTAAKGILRLSHLEDADGPIAAAEMVLPPELDDGASDDMLLMTEDLCYAVGFYDFTAKAWMTRYGQEYGREGLPAVIRFMPLP